MPMLRSLLSDCLCADAASLAENFPIENWGYAKKESKLFLKKISVMCLRRMMDAGFINPVDDPHEVMINSL